MKDLLSAARGDIPCDLVIKGGRIANVLSMEYEDADVAIKNGVIVGVGRGYDGATVVDASGATLMPGMIDGHLHIESTMLTPSAFASAVAPLGTTTVMPDPHEIANTCGPSGVEFMWRDALRTPIDMFFAAPSCVPASEHETPLRELDAGETAELVDRGWCGHLGEMMNFPGVISGDRDVWAKITAARGLVRTAHAPGVGGRDLCAYMLSGCDGDHESNFVGEALEKIRRGMWVMLREGATERNLEELTSLILEDEARFARCMAVSDDLSASFIISAGHMDHKMRVMTRRGLRPIVAAALVTINPANYFRLWDRGAIAPGRIADVVMVDSLEDCHALKVWKRGRLVAEDGRALFGLAPPSQPGLPEARRVATPGEDELRVPALSGRDIRVISTMPLGVLTKELRVPPSVRDGMVVSDTERDILKLVVVEKNRGTGRTAIGFVNGFGLKRGALASSVAHDAHNYMAVGVDDRSIAAALRRLEENRGGLTAADGDEITASLPLPVGGLMSDMEPRRVAAALEEMSRATAALGARLPQPFMTMSFLSLSVIPELRLTDRGYVSLSEGGITGLFV
jgi:adenine deaminase